MIQIEPGPAEAFRDRGLARLSSKEYDKAIADFTEAIRLDPKDVDSFFRRG